jgi:rhamnose utilization protein RhaD (predicted bifunctional aldolase and dehydrogenase)
MPGLDSLRALSAKLGQNLDLVQAGGGNTSLKDNGTLWVKASGKWLAHAMEEEMFLPVPVADILTFMDGDREYIEEYTTASGQTLRPSVETSMHALLPQRVVVHVHSVRTIAWAVRLDAPASLNDRLAGLRWEWVPYVHPGLVLGKEIRARLDFNPDVLILGNHGLIVAADDCDSAETLLNDVERRLDSPVRALPPADVDGLDRMTPDGYRIAPDPEVHPLAMDAFSRQVATFGTLFPDQCVYLGPKVLLIPGKGVLVANDLNRAGREVLIAVKRIIERLDPTIPIQFLEPAEVSRLMDWDAEKYRIAQACPPC